MKFGYGLHSRTWNVLLFVKTTVHFISFMALHKIKLQ